MTRRRLLLFGLLAGCASLGCIAAVWLRAGDSDFTPGITLENANRVRFGMTVQEVEAIFGGPSATTGPGRLFRGEVRLGITNRSWRDDDNWEVTVSFKCEKDRETVAQVCHYSYAFTGHPMVSLVDLHEYDSPLDKLCRWLRF
jgi:hypothetical protein